MSIPTSRDKRRALFTLSLRKVLIAFTALLFSYFLFLWFTISKHIDYHISVSQHDFRPQAQVKKNTSTKNTTDSVITIGIASTVTGCGEDPFTEGAAVLKYSIELTSIHGQKGGKYDYKFYIMYHSQAKECVLPLKELGFILLERPTPVNVSEIEGYVLRERISSNGCCGEKELIKLEAYRLTQHPVVIHLDLDVLVLHPMDSAIDLVLNPERYIENPSNKRDSDVPFMWPDLPIPDDISLLFTKDYNVVAPRRYDKPYQGGFIMIKPSEDVYKEMVEIVREGDYIDTNKRKGWGGKVGPFYGGMTIQGLLPWYYQYLHPGISVELNRCVYNNMADNPTTLPTVNDTLQGRCRTNEEKCEDCRKQPIEEIVTFHYTICQKPWLCLVRNKDILDQRLCRRMHHEWFKYRSDLEKSWGRNGTGSSAWWNDHFLGYCTHAGKRGYQKIQQPYGES